VIEQRRCLVCGIIQVPEPGEKNRISAGEPRFEVHHTSYVPEVTVMLCINCHEDVHQGRVRPDLLPPIAQRRAKLRKQRADAVAEKNRLKAEIDAIDRELGELGRDARAR